MAVQTDQLVFTGQVTALASSCAQEKSFLVGLSILYTKKVAKGCLQECHTGVACVTFYHQPRGKRYMDVYLFVHYLEWLSSSPGWP